MTGPKNGLHKIIAALLSRIGDSRILFSSDVVSQLPVELAKYRAIVPVGAALENILYKNVISVYKLKHGSFS